MGCQYSRNLFNKFSLLCVVLPYYGKIEEWRKLLSLLSRSSKEMLENNSQAFCNLNQMTTWDWNEELKSLLIKLDLDENPVLNEAYSLKLDILKKQESVFSFMSEAKSMKFKPIKKLQMTWMYKLNEIALNDTNAMFKSTFPSIQVLYLQG